MKAITLHEPWGSLIAHGLKQYETRSWKTSWRGPLLIHAARRPVDAAGIILLDKISKYSSDTELPYGRNRFPLGAVVAICNLTDCIEMTKSLMEQQTALEILVGNWGLGRFAWKLENIRLLNQPILAKGQQKLWNVSPELEQRILKLSTFNESSEQRSAIAN